MSYQLISSDPPEYHSSEPFECPICCEVYDLDEGMETGDLVETEDGILCAYCAAKESE